jgi:hypothetical protein
MNDPNTLERLAWSAGLLLIVVFAIARMHGAVASRAELARFQASRAATRGCGRDNRSSSRESLL